MHDRETNRLERRKAGARLGFQIHLAAYVAVNLLLAAINLTTTPHYLWCLWSLTGWGIGILFHGLATFRYARQA